MNKFLFVILSLVAFCSAAPIWKSCGTSSDDLTVTDVILTPDPPVIGKNFSVSAVGTLNKKLTNGTVNIVVYYGVIKLIDETDNLCSALSKGHTVDPKVPLCPVSPQKTQIVSPSALIPSSTPPGLYTGTGKAVDQDGKQISCIEVNITLS